MDMLMCSNTWIIKESSMFKQPIIMVIIMPIYWRHKMDMLMCSNIWMLKESSMFMRPIMMAIMPIGWRNARDILMCSDTLTLSNSNATRNNSNIGATRLRKCFKPARLRTSWTMIATSAKNLLHLVNCI